MIPALLHGKLSRQQENMEDILTSSVFGTLRHLPPEEGLFPFLRCTTMPDGGQSNAFDFEPGALVEYQFWPLLHERAPSVDSENWCVPCEPDVLLKIKPSIGPPTYILIEAKFRSGKSSEATDDESAPRDQLAREWDNLVALAHREGATPLLVYLTADFGMPNAEIDASMEEYRLKRGAAPFACGWLSWRHLERQFRRTEDWRLRELVDLCNRLDLRLFDGVSKIRPRAICWRFRTSPMQFRWLNRPLTSFSWRYEP